MGRDWQMNEEELRLTKLLEWIFDTGEPDPNVMAFYGDDERSTRSAYEDVAHLAAQGLANDSSTMGEASASLTPHGRSVVAEIRSRRSDRAARQAACRSSLVSWLYDQDACDDATRAVSWQGFFLDARSWFYGDAFTNDEVDRAAGWLQRQGLIGGSTVEEAVGPMNGYLTDDGVTCATEFDADPAAYLDARARSGSGGITVSGISGGNVQIAGHQAQQTMTVGTDATQVALMIRGIADLMRLTGLVDDAAEHQRIVDAAVDDVETGRNGGRVRDFLSWSKARVEAGTDSAVSAALAAGMITVADHAAQLGHFIGHL